MEPTACARSAICYGSARSGFGRFRTERWKNSALPRNASAGKPASCSASDLKQGGAVRRRSHSAGSSPYPFLHRLHHPLIIAPARFNGPVSFHLTSANRHAVAVQIHGGTAMRGDDFHPTAHLNRRIVRLNLGVFFG